MEETTETGVSRIRYHVGSSGEPLAEHRLGGPTGDTWVWLLRDAKGSVGTELKNDGTVIGQKAYDPYGAPESGGTSRSQTESRFSTFGFQAAHTDDVSGRILLGERQYDPTTERFTTPDVYVGSGLDLALGTDPVTGNRYVFAGANPVSFYDDGHRQCSGAHDCDAKDKGPRDPMTATAAEWEVDRYPDPEPSAPSAPAAVEHRLGSPVLNFVIDVAKTFTGKPQDNGLINSIPDVCAKGSYGERAANWFSISGWGLEGIFGKGWVGGTGFAGTKVLPVMTRNPWIAQASRRGALLLTVGATGLDWGCRAPWGPESGG